MNPKPLSISYDEQRDILTIEGYDYSGSLFRAMAGTEVGLGLALNQPMVIVERKDRLITFSRYEGGWWAWKALWQDICRFFKGNASKW